jgi:hypothetical protein
VKGRYTPSSSEREPRRPPPFKVVGYSASDRACDLCGKEVGLSGTVIAEALEPSGRFEAGEAYNFGSDCAARLTVSRDPVRQGKRLEISRAKEGKGDPDLGYSEAIAVFKSSDPSKVGKYLDWQLSMLIARVATAEEIAQVVALFHRFASQIDPRDINAYPPERFGELRDKLLALKEKQEKGAAARASRKSEEEPDYEIIYDSPNVEVVLIKNKAASVKFGAGTRWCTTAVSGNLKYKFNIYDAQNAVFFYLINPKLNEEFKARLQERGIKQPGESDFNLADPRYKICVNYLRDENSKIVRTIYWDATDQDYHDDKILRNLYGDEWNVIKAICERGAANKPKSLFARIWSGDWFDDKEALTAVDFLYKQERALTAEERTSFDNLYETTIDKILAGVDVSQEVKNKIILDKAKNSKSFNLSGTTQLTSLPEGLSVGGNLYLEGCTGLTSLPEGLSVGGNLYLEGCTGLTSLPERLSVGGDLNLRRLTKLTSLPEGLSVGRNLYLKGCTGLTSLPEGLSVGADLYLEGCTGLTSLPEGLSVGRNLSLEGCTGLTSLPEGLSVGADLYLEGCTGLTSLPEGLSVARNLYLEGCTGLTSLPEGLSVGRNLYLEGCTGLTSLPADLVVGNVVEGVSFTNIAEEYVERAKSRGVKFDYAS